MTDETRVALTTILYIPAGIWLIACVLIILARMGKLGNFGDWMIRKEKKIVAFLAIIFAFGVLIAGVGALFKGA